MRDGLYDWRRLPTGAGGFVTGIVVHPTAPGVMYARTDVGGAYRWDAAKEVWVQMLTAGNVPDPNQNPGDYSVESVATAPSDPSIVYLAVGNDSNPSDAGALTGTGRVLRSADGGRTWTTSAQRWFISGNEQYRTGSERLAIDPSDAKHIVFGTRREGLWQSTDGGDSWVQVRVSSVPAGLSDHPTDDQVGVGFVAFGSPAATSPAPLYVGVANVGTFASTDGGASWNRIDIVRPGAYPSGGVVVDQKLYFATETLDGSNGEVTTFDPATGTASSFRFRLTAPSGSSLSIRTSRRISCSRTMPFGMATSGHRPMRERTGPDTTSRFRPPGFPGSRRPTSPGT